MISVLLILISSLFFAGIIGRVRSILAGRKGPDVLQPLRNIWLLLRKGSVFSQTSGVLLQIAPSVSLIATLIAALLIPFGGRSGIFSFSYDFVFFAYLMATARFLMVVAALDTGSSFEGMGAARESLYAMLAEPAFFLLLGSLSLISHATSFAGIFAVLALYHLQYILVAMLAVFVFFNLALVETCRLPVDDPKTHLELTMIHEVMVLDLSGFDLGLVQIVNLIKFGIYGSLVANCIIPQQWGLAAQTGLFFAIQILFATAIGFVEAFRARNRLNHNAQYILAMTAVALIVFVLTMFL
jgi:formate hydrogenlyase subunit 4